MNREVVQSRARIAWHIAGWTAAVTTVALMVWFWQGGLPYDATSGVWTVLADDVSRGEIYRPVFNSEGFGGTRYMPLFFVLHGALIALGLPASPAGAALTVFSIALMLAATFLLMKRFGVSKTIAVSGTLLITASVGFQLLSVAIKGDLLAAALNVGGLALAVAGLQQSDRRFAWAAGALLGCAALTKFTEAFAIATLLLWCARERRWRGLWDICFPAIATIGAGLTAAYWASDGRIVEAFAVSATGGLKLEYAFKFPFWFLSVAVQDPFFLALFLCAAVVACRRWRRAGLDLVTLYFLVTAWATGLMFASPGTDSNHLMDLLAASVVMLAVEFSAGKLNPRIVRWTAFVFGLAIAATWLPGVPSVRHFFEARGRPTTAAVEEVLRRLPPTALERLLSENPMIPVAAGERAPVLDSFSLRLLAARSPEARAAFFSNLTERRYSAVILMDWSGLPLEERWREIERHSSLGVTRFYGEVHFPTGFLEALKTHYRLSFVVDTFVVFEPIGSEP